MSALFFCKKILRNSLRLEKKYLNLNAQICVGTVCPHFCVEKYNKYKILITNF